MSPDLPEVMWDCSVFVALDLPRSKLHVRRTIWRGVSGLPKGGRERTVDLLSSAVEALKGYRHLRGPFVFCQEDGQPLTDGLMNGPLRRALRAADICHEQERIGWHDLRHNYGSHLAMRGVPLTVIKELMGHATIDMTALRPPEPRHPERGGRGAGLPSCSGVRHTCNPPVTSA